MVAHDSDRRSHWWRYLFHPYGWPAAFACGITVGIVYWILSHATDNGLVIGIAALTAGTIAGTVVEFRSVRQS